jgi:hypothetical protein
MFGISRVISSGSQLGIAGFDFEFFDVDRSVVVFLDQLFADQDGVFEVVTAPRHERHEHVTAEGQFAHIGARTIGQHLPFFTAAPARSASG